MPVDPSPREPKTTPLRLQRTAKRIMTMGKWLCSATCLGALCVVLRAGVTMPAASAQTASSVAPAAAEQTAQDFDPAQLDALLAPIALYPDELLTQILMAVTFPLQIVEAARWLDDLAHKSLTGQALTDALKPLSWDPSVKSLVPFPQVLTQLNANLDWVQQLGYAVASQQKDVMNSIQHLRLQAQSEGHLQSSAQQVVKTEAQPSGQSSITIQPAQPDIVYVPSYNPTQVYGTWPYADYPPVVLPPPPGYAVGTALVSGLAFGAGVAITAGLWNWATPNWGGGNFNVNVNRWNNINVNRASIHSGTWNVANRPGGRPPIRPTNGPVGHPVRGNGLSPKAIGRPNVHVPASAVNRPQHPTRTNPGQHVNLSSGSRPNAPAHRPNAPANRPNLQGSHPNLQGNRPNLQANRPSGGAFSGMNQGNRATQFQQRGMQSHQSVQRHQGGFQRGGGEHFRGGGGGGRSHGRR